MYYFLDYFLTFTLGRGRYLKKQYVLNSRFLLKTAFIYCLYHLFYLNYILQIGDILSVKVVNTAGAAAAKYIVSYSRHNRFLLKITRS